MAALGHDRVRAVRVSRHIYMECPIIVVKQPPRGLLSDAVGFAVFDSYRLFCPTYPGDHIIALKPL